MGVSYIKSAFTYSPSNTSPNPNQGWHYDMSNIARPEGYFLWMRDDIFYTDGTDNSTDGRLVVEGKDGKDGVDGDDAFPASYCQNKRGGGHYRSIRDRNKRGLNNIGYNVIKKPISLTRNFKTRRKYPILGRWVI